MLFLQMLSSHANAHQGGERKLFTVREGEFVLSSLLPDWLFDGATLEDLSWKIPEFLIVQLHTAIFPATYNAMIYL